MMKLKTQEFVEKWLTKARYSVDESVGAWAGWIDGETVRAELAEILYAYR